MRCITALVTIGTKENFCHKRALMLFKIVSGSNDFRHLITTHCAFPGASSLELLLGITIISSNLKSGQNTIEAYHQILVCQQSVRHSLDLFVIVKKLLLHKLCYFVFLVDNATQLLIIFYSYHTLLEYILWSMPIFSIMPMPLFWL